MQQSLKKQQLTQAVSVGFFALAGQQPDSTLQYRSRAIAHLLGLALHRTHVPCAALYTWVRCFLRSVVTLRCTYASWSTRWEHRRRMHSGFTAQVMHAADWLGIVWSSPTQFSYRGLVFAYRIPDDIVDSLGQLSARGAMSHNAIRKVLHDCRTFLRTVVARSEANRRSKDFAGIDDGLEEGSYMLSEAMAILSITRSGPALSTGGLWTKIDIARLPHSNGDEPA